MKLELAQFLVECSENAGNDAELRKYSGRGMMGRETYGVVVSSLPLLLADVLQWVKENGNEPMASALNWEPEGLRVDNMGNNTIVY